LSSRREIAPMEVNLDIDERKPGVCSHLLKTLFFFTAEGKAYTLIYACAAGTVASLIDMNDNYC
jgi:hypothetical protein